MAAIVAFLFSSVWMFSSVSDANTPAIPTVTQTSKFKIRFQLEPGADTRAVGTEAYSYITRELRSLGDVEVVEGVSSQYRYEIRIAVQELGIPGETAIASILSVVVLRHYWDEDPRIYMLRKTKEDISEVWQRVREAGVHVEESLIRRMDVSLNLLAAWTNSIPSTSPTNTRVVYHMIYTSYAGVPDSLRRTCETLISHFDGVCLKRDRAGETTGWDQDVILMDFKRYLGGESTTPEK